MRNARGCGRTVGFRLVRIDCVHIAWLVFSNRIPVANFGASLCPLAKQMFGLCLLQGVDAGLASPSDVAAPGSPLASENVASLEAEGDAQDGAAAHAPVRDGRGRGRRGRDGGVGRGGRRGRAAGFVLQQSSRQKMVASQSSRRRREAALALDHVADRCVASETSKITDIFLLALYRRSASASDPTAWTFRARMGAPFLWLLSWTLDDKQHAKPRGLCSATRGPRPRGW